MTREQEIQKLCIEVLALSPRSTGDTGSGAVCPLCYIDCKWDAYMLKNIEHHLYCPVLIAKDLITK